MNELNVELALSAINNAELKPNRDQREIDIATPRLSLTIGATTASQFFASQNRRMAIDSSAVV